MQRTLELLQSCAEVFVGQCLPMACQTKYRDWLLSLLRVPLYEESSKYHRISCQCSAPPFAGGLGNASCTTLAASFSRMSAPNLSLIRRWTKQLVGHLRPQQTRSIWIHSLENICRRLDGIVNSLCSCSLSGCSSPSLSCLWVSLSTTSTLQFATNYLEDK